MLKKIIFASIVTVGYLSSMKCMDQAEVEINGVTKPMLGHIMQAILDPKKEVFSVTHIVRFVDEHFVLKGDLCTIDEDDIKDVEAENFVYVPFYTLAKTRLSPGTYEEVGAIIVGTKDPKKAQELHFAAMRSATH